MIDEVKPGDLALIFFDERRKFLVEIREGCELHTDKGYVRLGELIGLKYGSSHKTSLGVEFRVLKPTLMDLVLKVPRKTQIIYPKDSGFILLLSGVGPGSRVVEAGTGSGALTMVLAYHVRPNGKVYSYEVNREYLDSARRVLERAGLIGYVELKRKDVRKGIDEVDVDSVILDMPDPWNVLEPAHKSLRSSGTLIAFVPTTNQVEKLANAMREHGGYMEPEAYEIMLRQYKTRRGEIRPYTWMVGHTGYIVFTRKVES